MGFWRFLQLTKNWRKGLLGGLVLVAIATTLNLLRMQVLDANYQGLGSISLAGWLNVVIGAPVVEEVFFRGVVFKALYNEYGYWRAATASSILFVGIHLPYWILAGVFSPEMIGTCASILILGYVLCLSMKLTGSLLTPTIGHIINNLLSILIR